MRFTIACGKGVLKGQYVAMELDVLLKKIFRVYIVHLMNAKVLLEKIILMDSHTREVKKLKKAGASFVVKTLSTGMVLKWESM